MNEITNYDKAVEIIKKALVQSQYNVSGSILQRILQKAFFHGQIQLSLLHENSHNRLSAFSV